MTLVKENTKQIAYEVINALVNQIEGEEQVVHKVIPVSIAPGSTT